jgi:hypothetical protein
METIREIWRQQSIGTVFKEHMDISPIGADVDLIFTTNRLVAVIAEKREKSTSWVYGSMAGPIGLMASGAIAALWETYQSATKDRKIDSQALDLLVQNGLAMSANASDLVCEIYPYKKAFSDYLTIIPDTKSMVSFYGKFSFRDTSLDGAIYQIKHLAHTKARHTIQNLLPIKVEVGEQIVLTGPNPVEIRVVGKDLAELRRQRYKKELES